MGNAEFDATERVRLDEIDEFPADGTLREPGLKLADHAGRGKALKEASDGAGEADVDLGDAKFDVVVGADFREIDIVDADDFAAGGVDDLLVEEIFLDGEPAFVGLVGIKCPLADVEFDAAGGDSSDLIVAGNEGLEAAPRDEEMGDTIGLISRLDEEFADTPDKIVLRVIGGGAHEFCSVKHVVAPF